MKLFFPPWRGAGSGSRESGESNEMNGDALWGHSCRTGAERSGGGGRLQLELQDCVGCLTSRPPPKEAAHSGTDLAPIWPRSPLESTPIWASCVFEEPTGREDRSIILTCSWSTLSLSLSLSLLRLNLTPSLRFLTSLTLSHSLCLSLGLFLSLSFSLHNPNENNLSFPSFLY